MKKYLSAVAIIKNESKYILEWLAFHYLVGVEQFFLFDNNSNDNLKEKLKQFPIPDIIQYFFWPEHPGQYSAYQYVIDNLKDKTHWCAFIDIDEFLFSNENDNLKKILEDYDRTDISALAAHWLIFGSSGHKFRPPGLCIDEFTKRAPDDFPMHNHPKSIVKLEEVIKPANCHLFFTKNFTVNERKIQLNPVELPEEWSYERIRINHYFFKSYEEWKIKQRRGRADLDIDHENFYRKIEEFDLHNRNDIEDKSATRYSNAILKLLDGNL